VACGGARVLPRDEELGIRSIVVTFAHIGGTVNQAVWICSLQSLPSRPLPVSVRQAILKLSTRHCTDMESPTPKRAAAKSWTGRDVTAKAPIEQAHPYSQRVQVPDFGRHVDTLL
jgi:hypothetical protein